MISPEGVSHMSGNGPWAPNSDFAQKYCYVYFYDSRGRMVEKRLPGAEPQYFVYDNGDRPVFFQDGNMRADGNKWKATFYDGCGRMVREDLRNGGAFTRAQLQAAFDSSNTHSLYTTTIGVTLLHLQVWDTYPQQMPQDLAFLADTVATSAMLRSSHKGLLVYEELNVLGTTQYAKRARYYDREDRVIQEVTLYPDGYPYRESVRYDRRNNALCTLCTVSLEYALHSTLVVNNTYDARDRLISSSSFLNGVPLSSVTFTYDDLGRLIGKTYGNGVTDSYAYNMQGWKTTQSTSCGDTDLFSSTLRYHDAFNSVTIPSWTGDISSWSWTQSGQDERTYVFGYDSLDRLVTTSQYRNNSFENKYGEDVSYDMNGNITSIGRRNGSTSTETEYFTYTGNKRSGWLYDANGNVTCEDPEAYIPVHVGYNLINLPTNINPEEGHWSVIRYLADGTKYSLYDDDTLDGFIYCGPFRCETGMTEVKDVEVPGGRAKCGMYSASMRYYTVDHLGSTRLVTDASGGVKGQYDYLPYGGKCDNTGLEFGYVGYTDYLYCGKEWHELFGIDWYDSKSRYLNTSGIFTSIDPLAEKYPGISPYAYCAGDPVNRVDPEGEDEWEINSQGKVVKQITNKEHDAFFMVDDMGNRHISSDGSYLSISFNNKTFSSATKDSITAFSTKDVTAGADLFKFMSDFTDIEQGLIIGDFGAFVFNEGLNDKIGITSMARRISYILDTSVSKLIHSHPGNSKPSKAEEEGDIHAAKKMLSYAHRYVYTPGTNSLIPYYGKGASDPIPWKSVFPKTRFK